MNIDLNATPGLSQALIARLTKELGETGASNFCLDILGDAQALELIALREHNAALVERTTKDRVLVESLRNEIEMLKPRPKAKTKK